MATKLIYRGKSFKIFAWAENDSCQVIEFLSQLDDENDSDSKRLVYLMRRTADIGIIRNERQSRQLKDGIYEFKAPNTSRILYFYDRDSIIICTHGFGGKRGAGKTAKTEIARAEQIRERYYEEKSDVENEKRKRAAK